MLLEISKKMRHRDPTRSVVGTAWFTAARAQGPVSGVVLKTKAVGEGVKFCGTPSDEVTESTSTSTSMHYFYKFISWNITAVDMYCNFYCFMSACTHAHYITSNFLYLAVLLLIF